MSDTSELLQQYLADHYEHVFIDAETGQVVFPHAGEGACWWVRAGVDEERGALTITSHCPVFTPRDRVATMCEFLQRCHNEIISGHFRLDFRDGEITFCTGLFFGAAGIDEELVGHLVEGNVSSVQYFLPGMMAVAYGDATPAAALGLPLWPERLLTAEVEAGLGALLGEVAPAPADAASPRPAAGGGTAGAGTVAAEARESFRQCLLALLARLTAETEQLPGRRPSPPGEVGGAVA